MDWILKALIFISNLILSIKLSWILHCVTAKGLMNRAHAYKALKENNDDDKGINMGLFSYPILMAADILMFNSTHVPVGPDQLQHLEMTKILQTDLIIYLAILLRFRSNY